MADPERRGSQWFHNGRRKMEDADSGKPRAVEDDPWEELFADCVTAEDVLQLQADIDAMEARQRQK
jgi:hypothetical protein